MTNRRKRKTRAESPVDGGTTVARTEPDVTPDATLDRLLVKFAAAEAIWYASVRPDGRPHLAPIWHVWHADAAWVVTQRSTVRAVNLFGTAGKPGNPYVSLSLADPMNALILEGVAAEAPGAVELIRPAFQSKYDWNIATDADYQCIIRVAPTKLLAWGNHGEGRWRFGAGGWEATR